jgi:hypothetical protein
MHNPRKPDNGKKGCCKKKKAEEKCDHNEDWTEEMLGQSVLLFNNSYNR